MFACADFAVSILRKMNKFTSSIYEYKFGIVPIIVNKMWMDKKNFNEIALSTVVAFTYNVQLFYGGHLWYFLEEVVHTNKQILLRI